MTPPERIDVWLAAPSSSSGLPVDAVLTPAELSRAALLGPRRSAAFVTGRLVLRSVLGLRLGCLPRNVTLDTSCRCGEQHGAVTVQPAGPWVSVTRNGPLVAVVVRDAGPVGVDLASVREVGAAPLANVLPPPGPDAGDQPRPECGRSLAERWVRAEATLKMMGTGLRRDPATVHVDAQGLGHLDGAAVARVLDLPEPDGHGAAQRGTGLGDGVVGALALGGAAALDVTHTVRVRLRDARSLFTAPSS